MNLRDTFKGRIETGTIKKVGAPFQVRADYDVREFLIELHSLEGGRNCVVRMQLNKEKINLLDNSHIGKDVEVWYFINGVMDSKERIHNVLNCVRLIVL